jgi:EmrB/QacA subfamily drug resistance transporter
MNLTLQPVQKIVASSHYKWWAYIAIAVGTFQTVMDQSGVNIALPNIAEHFHADIPTVQWITLGYILSTSALVVPAGRLSDMIGRKYVYMFGFVIFIAAAAVGGMSQTFSLLVVAKVIQGIGAAGIQANGMAMMADIFPENERGKALGLHMATVGTGAISGPIIGGFLVSALGWRSVFLASVPVGIVALTLAFLVLQVGTRARGADSRAMRFDWGGAGLSSAALVSILLALTNSHRLGWGSPAVIAGFVVGFLLMAAFVWWERRTTDPMLDLDFFRNRVFSLGISARFLSFLGGSAVFFLMPFYLVQGLGYEPSRAGLLMVPGSICMAIMGPLSGRFSDAIGTRWLSVGGMALSTTAMLLFFRLSMDSPPIHVIVGMIIHGCGMGMFSSPNTSAIMSSLDRKSYGIASAFVNMTRTTANLSGIAIATTVVTLTMAAMGFEPSLAAVTDTGGTEVRVAFITGLNRAYLASAALAFVAMVISLTREEGKVPEQSVSRAA